MCSDSKPPTPKHCLILLSPRHQLPMNQRCLAATPKHWHMDLNEAAETHHRKTDSFWLWQFLLFFTVWGCYIWVQFVFVQQFLWILVQEGFLLKWVGFSAFQAAPLRTRCGVKQWLIGQSASNTTCAAIHHRGIDDHTTKCRSSLLK